MSKVSNDKCRRCKEYPATHKWCGTGGALALTHGFYEMWCERCVTEVQLAHAKERAKEVIRLETELTKLGGPAQFVRCGGFCPNDDGVYLTNACNRQKNHSGECSVKGSTWVVRSF